MALTPAEKQRRYRARLKEKNPVVVHFRTPKDRRSKAQQWRDAVATLTDLQADWSETLDRLPESLVQSAYGERLQAMADLDLDALETLDPPLGYGRD